MSLERFYRTKLWSFRQGWDLGCGEHEMFWLEMNVPTSEGPTLKELQAILPIFRNWSREKRVMIGLLKMSTACSSATILMETTGLLYTLIYIRRQSMYMIVSWMWWRIISSCWRTACHSRKWFHWCLIRCYLQNRERSLSSSSPYVGPGMSPGTMTREIVVCTLWSTLNVWILDVLFMA